VTGGAGTYVYAVTRPLPDGLPAGLCGIHGGPLRALAVDDLACVVSSVELDQFAAEPFRRNLEDLRWLERVAREHDAVVQALSAVTTTVPLRLGAVYSDDQSAQHRVRGLREPALATLETLDGREEWGVKIYAVPRRAEPPAGDEQRPASGLDYLRRRREQLERTTLDARGLADDAEEVFAALSALAVQGRRHRPQDPALSGVKHPMLVNAAFLVPRDERARFQQAVTALSAERPAGAMVATGPWPAYSFATLDDG